MKHRLQRTLLPMILIAVFCLSACSNSAPKGQPQTPEILPPTQAEKDSFAPTEEEMKKLNSPESLQNLWSTLLWRASYNFQDGFSSYEDLSTWQILTMVDNVAGDAGDFVLSEGEIRSEDPEKECLSKTFALRYVKKIFNKDSLPEDNSLGEEIYVNEKTKETYYTGFWKWNNPRNLDAYDAKNPFALSEIRYVGNNKYEAIIERWDMMEDKTKKMVRTQTYTLQKREDNSFYLESAKSKWTNFNAISLEGNYKEFSMEGKNELLHLEESLTLPDEKLLFANLDGEKITLTLLDATNGDVLKTNVLEQAPGERIVGSSFKNGHIYFKTSKKTYVLTPELKKTKEVSVPEYTLEMHGHYDITADLSKVVYEDLEGLKILTLETGDKEVLKKHTALGTEKENFMDAKMFAYPFFADDDKKVFARELGYEWVNYYLLIDLESKKETVYDISYDYNGTISLRDDMVTVMIASDGDESASQYDIRFINLKTGEEKKIAQTINGRLCSSYGSDNGVYYFIENQGEDFNSYSLYFLDASSGKESKLEFEVKQKASEPYFYGGIKINGITEKGNPVYSYFYYAEEGCGVVEAKVKG